MLRIIGLFLVVANAAACGSDGAGGLLGGDPVGRWRQLPNLANDEPPDDVEDRHVLELSADGTMLEIDGPDDVSTGTWVVEGVELVMTQDDGDTTPFRIPFRSRGDVFVLGALTPVGTTDRGVGTWTSTIDDFSTPDETDSLTVTMDLRPDNTATVDYDFVTREDIVFEGTWTNRGDDFRLELMDDEVNIGMTVTFVDGVMGSPYERI